MAAIRPLSVFKRECPEAFKQIESFSRGEGASKKGKEDLFYRWYAVFFYKNPRGDGPQGDGFIFSAAGNFANKTLVTELGRLLLTGWYYRVNDITEDVVRWVHNSYCQQKEKFNEEHFVSAIQHIRENLPYYAAREDELKLYILESFFADRLKPLLPPLPEELERHDAVLDMILKNREANLKKDKYYYFKETDRLEGYVEYLKEILEDHGIKFQSYEDFVAEDEAMGKEYFEKVAQAKNEYRARVKALSSKTATMLT